MTGASLMLFRISRWAVMVMVFTSLALMARSQHTNVVCPDSMGWANNTMNQNPCLMAAYAYQPCQPDYTVQAMPSNSGYSLPDNSTIQHCLCNTVAYSLLAACSTCQNITMLGWSSWTLECPSAFVGNSTYPQGVPSGTIFPPWTYMQLSNDAWNEASAKENASAVASQIPSSIASVSATSVAASRTNAPTASFSKSRTNTGAIAGGVVGGVVGIALIAGTAFLCFRRSNKQGGIQPETDLINGPPPEVYQPPMSPSTTLKLYDPDDPSTYPISPPPGSEFSPTSAGHYKPHHTPQKSTDSSSITYTATLPKGYTGAAEA